MKDYYISKENGNIVTWGEMMAEMVELYDGNDPTNWLDWHDYYDFCGTLDLGD